MKKLSILRTILFATCLLFPYVSNAQWSGTGFSIGGRYVVTNYHVVEGASKISIGGTKGEVSFEYAAEVIAKDSANDLAILKIVDSRYVGFGDIPYSTKAELADIGEDIFALGYPLVQTMGSDIKLSTGIISSQSGYQNNATLYQISAPVQPGNSGGPLFDYGGNLIGVICAKHKGAENVNYAIKASYLMSLIKNTNLRIESPADNIISNLSLPEKVKKIRDFVFIVKCYSESQQHVEHSQSNVSEACKMYYTTSDGASIKILSTSFDANIVSNICKDGKGVVVFSAPITNIGESAFCNCDNLMGIAIPNSVKKIGEDAFFDCDNLTKVVIGENVVSIGKDAFGNCDNIMRVYVESLSSWCKIDFENNGSHPFAYGKAKLCIGNEEVTNIVIPDDITAIKRRTFSTMKNITSLTIGNHVRSIGESAFQGCSNLKNVVIGNGVTCIGGGAFRFCENLSEVFIGNSVEIIEDDAFSSCKCLQDLCIGCKVSSIGDYAFSMCESLTSVTIPDSVTSIGEGAFQHCYSIKTFYGKFASSDNRCLIINGVLRCFAIGCGLAQYSIPNGVTTIGKGAFEFCDCLQNVTIPNSVINIEDSAFARCCNLRNISLPNSVMKIGNLAFYGCDSLSSVMMGTGVIFIGSSVFAKCNNLTAFYGKLASEDNCCLILNGILKSFAVGCGITEYTIPRVVATIDNNAFCGCKSIKNLFIPNSVVSIKNGAFNKCTSLRSISIPNSVTSIGYEAFYGCINLKTVILKSATPPSIESKVFKYYDNKDAQYEWMGKHVNIGCDIYVPQQSISIYKSAKNWSEYADYIVGYDF